VIYFYERLADMSSLAGEVEAGKYAEVPNFWRYEMELGEGGLVGRDSGRGILAMLGDKVGLGILG
jgi:hypothetical protein